MSFEPDLVAFLNGNSTITDVIGTRLYPDMIPQDVTMPAVSYQIISRQGEHSTPQGFSNLAKYRVQFTVVAESALSRAVVVDAWGTAVDGMRAGLIQAGFFDNQVNSYVMDTERYVSRIDYMFWYGG